MTPVEASRRAAPIEELRPRQIARIVAGSGVAFIPVSPCFEWHSYHLPMGTDGLVAEAVSQLLAERFDGAWFRCLSCGLDAWRDAAFKTQQGLPSKAAVFGMDFPGLPLGSEYVAGETLQAIVRQRLLTVKRSGFRRAFVVNHHGGMGQRETLEAVAAEVADASFRIVCLCPGDFCTCELPPALSAHLRVGGHAGLLETTQTLAFRPELVDVEELPEGPLSPAAHGILHSEPVIPAELSPRRAVQAAADAYRHNVIANLVAHIGALVAQEARGG